MQINIMEYNTQREHLKLREYGRNVQNLVEHLKKESDDDKRTEKAQTMVELMKQINPALNKDNNENDQKIWDDIHIISDFELDVSSPYPKPDPAMLNKRPDRLSYFSNEIKYRHFGRSIELLIEKACGLEDPKEIEGAVIVIGKLMKSFYQTWNRDNPEDDQILGLIRHMSGGKLDIDLEKVKEFNLFDMAKPNNGHRNRRNKSGGKGRKPNNPKRRRHNK
jgi:hypothetical protein